MVAVVVEGAKDLDDLLTDAAFWERWRAEVVGVWEQIARVIFLAGADAGREIAPAAAKQLLPLDPEEINQSASRVLATYTDAWWRQFSVSTQSRIRDAIDRARIQGTGIEGVLRDLEPVFGPRRVVGIAVTETTRLFGLGAQATYAAAGLESWSWQTVRDIWVDPICASRQGQRFPISLPFEPAHPRCVFGDALVAGPRFLAATARWYEGEAIILKTALGNELAVTPNHPIATPTGWRAARPCRAPWAR